MISTIPQWMSSRAWPSVLLGAVLLVHSPAGAANQDSGLQGIRATLASTLDKRQDTGDDSSVQQLEPAMILATNRRAVRKGNTLTLNFSNGKSHSYITKGDCETLMGMCQDYALLAFVRPAGFFLVQERFYERVGCLIVDSYTGRETVLPDIPYLGPEGDRLLVVAGTDGGGGHWPTQIWRRRGDTAFIEWKQSEAPSKIPVAISATRWDRTDRIDLAMISEPLVEPPPAGFVPRRWSATVIRTSRGWTMSRVAGP